MTAENREQRPAPKTYQSKKKQRWPTRIVVAAISVAAMLGLWQIVANEPAASAHAMPSFQDAEQQLQLGAPNNGYTPNNTSPPNVISGMS